MAQRKFPHPERVLRSSTQSKDAPCESNANAPHFSRKARWKLSRIGDSV
jgi:hypothetical protein